VLNPLRGVHNIRKNWVYNFPADWKSQLGPFGGRVLYHGITNLDFLSRPERWDFVDRRLFTKRGGKLSKTSLTGIREARPGQGVATPGDIFSQRFSSTRGLAHLKRLQTPTPPHSRAAHKKKKTLPGQFDRARKRSPNMGDLSISCSLNQEPPGIGNLRLPSRLARHVI